ncbi:MAG: Holliday junction resolvase RuvX [Deltaproteobacteria bacterium]|nr:Holliday junction resolvase RuvX [Deltaproteobacteria bacterium]MBI4373302.1 Holliday junction resolvase RuvX [Deltaproteobacteria bacterium]
MRILALDIGSKTIGVAVSDPMGWTAQPVKTIRRQGRVADEAEIGALIKEYEVNELLIGLPLHMNGTEGKQVDAVRGFARNLGETISVPVKFWDERLSTVAANRALLEADLSRSKRREVVDKMAAVFILQGYLDSLNQPGEDEANEATD